MPSTVKNALQNDLKHTKVRDPGGTLILHPLRRPREQIIRPDERPLRPRQAARPDVVVVLADTPMRVLDLEPLERVGEHAVAGGEEGVLQRLGGGEALLRVVLEQAGEQLIPFGAERGQRRDGRLLLALLVRVLGAAAAAGVPVRGGVGRGGAGPAGVVDGVVVPLLEAGRARVVPRGPVRGGVVVVAAVVVVMVVVAVAVVGRRAHGAELRPVGHVLHEGPALARGQAHDLDDLLHLVLLEGHLLLVVHLGLLALEDGPQGEQLGEDAADGPEVDGGRVVVRAEDQLRRAVPYGHDHLVTAVQRGQRLVHAAGEAQIADLDAAAVGDHDVGRLQVAVQHPARVQVVAAVEQLEQQRLDDGRGDGTPRARRLRRVVVDDLQQVVLGVLEDHEDALVLEDGLDEAHDVGVAQLGAQAHLADGRLRDARVANQLALLIGLELLDSDVADRPGVRVARDHALEGDGPRSRLVDAAVGSTANEADDAVALRDARLGLVARAADAAAVPVAV